MSKNFTKIKADDFNYSAFKLIGKDWMQITCKLGDKVNTMTASWGGIGIMWGKTVAYIFIRPKRFTKTLVDKTDYLTLQVLSNAMRKTSNYFGTASGFNEDKIKTSGVTVVSDDKYAYFEESDVVLKCKKLYAQEMKEECFIDKESDTRWYEAKDYHTMYVVEIDSIEVSDDFKTKLNQQIFI